MKKTRGFSALLLLAGCSFAPDYTPPDAAPPATYKENGAWAVAQPQECIENGAWWKAFHDPQLDSLEEQVTTANQNLKVALAQYEEARAIAAQARGAYFPTITGNASGIREQDSRNVANRAPIYRYNDFTLGADLTYEIDIWGRVRNTVAANEDQADASAADLAGVALSLHAAMANDYFALRGDDASQSILDDTVTADQQAYDLTERRYNGGVVPESDLDQARTQLENAKTQASDMRLQRAQMEHAIAVLVGKAPAEFDLPPAAVMAQLPPVNAGIPSTLLQRRPDITAAEKQVEAANAEIGVARAAWFPTFSLTGSFGFESGSAASWLNVPSHFWSMGPTATLPIFNGGAIAALNEEARATYEESVGTYREVVLEAYQDVEDDLVAMHRLAEEKTSQDEATKAAKRGLVQANERYKGGVTTFLDVTVAQNLELQARLAQTNIMTRQLTARVQLIQALGGGWNKGDIAAYDAMMRQKEEN